MLVEQWDQNRRSAPIWVADFPDEDELARFPAAIDPAQFTDQGGLLVTSPGIIAANATSGTVTVTSPLGGFVTNVLGTNPKIPTGTVIYFGGAKVMQLTQDLFLGDTTAHFAALPTALAAADTARYNALNKLYVPSGTIVGRTFTERTAGTNFGPGDVVTPDDELFLTYTVVHDARVNSQVTLLRPKMATAIYENFLPNYASLTAQQLAWLRANYECILGATAP